MTAFEDLVRSMRKSQKQYYATRDPGVLREAKDWERKVDAALQEAAQAKQPSLFGKDEIHGSP